MEELKTAKQTTDACGVESSQGQHACRGTMLLTNTPWAYDSGRLRKGNSHRKNIPVPGQLDQRQERQAMQKGKENLVLFISHLPGVVEKLAITFKAAIYVLFA